MLSLLAAAILSSSNSHAPNHRSIDEIVEAAWQDSAQEKSKTISPEDEKRHQDDIEKDKKIGKEAVIEIDKQLKPSKDENATARLKAIGAEMAEIANANSVSVMWGDQRHNQFDYDFKLVEGDDVNAFSLPGGTIYFYEGLMKFAESDDEVAGVVAHEISHASFRHLDALRREQSKFDLAQLPILIAAALGGGRDAMNALIAVQLVGAGVSSGWSVKAETAADYGGLQYMKLSRYNAVGLLTFMERLGYRERLSPQIDWGIYRTHPPTSERANFIIRSMNEFGIPIKRSLSTTSLSARSIPAPDGSFGVWFGDYEIAVYRGETAKDRGAKSVIRINAFLDSVPQMFQLSTNGDEIMGNGRSLIDFNPEDIAPDQTLAKERDDALVSLRRIISELNMRLWRG
ncbi:MAG: M48 family metalloprotease [Fimbriimonadaceae bacterium]